MIVGFRELTEALGGLFSEPSLRVYSASGRLPLTRYWQEGKRAFDPVEVEQFRTAIANKRQKRQTKQI